MSQGPWDPLDGGPGAGPSRAREEGGFEYAEGFKTFDLGDEDVE